MVAGSDGDLAIRSYLRRSRARGVSRVNVKDAAGQFLANKRIAVTGVSRMRKGHGSNLVCQRLRKRGY